MHRRHVHQGLAAPTTADNRVVLSAHASMAADGFEFALGLTAELSFPDYLEALIRQAAPDPTADTVPATFLPATVNGEIVGRTSICHRLNNKLRNRGVSATGCCPSTGAAGTPPRSCHNHLWSRDLMGGNASWSPAARRTWPRGRPSNQTADTSTRTDPIHDVGHEIMRRYFID